MKVGFRHRAAVQELSGKLAETVDDLITGINIQPLEVGNAKVRSGTLTPEGRLAGNMGDIFLRTDGSPAGALYVKQTGLNTTTGWVLFDSRKGTWTPTDASGAGLAFTVADALWTRNGTEVQASATVTFPATASGAAVAIGGLPFALLPAVALYPVIVSFSNNAGAIVFAGRVTQTSTLAFSTFGGVAITNANLTGSILRFTAIYQTTA